MKSTVEISNYISDEELKPLVLKELKVHEVYDMMADKLKVTIDWDVNLREKNLSYSSRFGGFGSYAYLDFSISAIGKCEIIVQYYLSESDSGDYVTIAFDVDVELQGVENVQHDAIQPTDAEIDFANRTVAVTF